MSAELSLGDIRKIGWTAGYRAAADADGGPVDEAKAAAAATENGYPGNDGHRVTFLAGFEDGWQSYPYGAA